MRSLRLFLRDASGATAAEFALILPVVLLFLLGIIDVGRYAWTLNQIQKATQMGARYAVATQIVPQGLNEWDPVGAACPGGTLAIGDPICKEALGTISCTAHTGSVTCRCVLAPCPDPGSANAGAFANIVARMRAFAPLLTSDDVTVKYSGSGIGYAGDPATDDNGNPLSDVEPLVTVQVASLRLRAMMLFGGNVTLPTVSTSLTAEDADGTLAY